MTGYYWADAEGYSPSYALPQKYNDLFKWLEIEPENPQTVRYLRLTGKADKGLLALGALALYSAVGESRDPLGRLNVSPAPLSARNGTDLTGITVSGADALFDEQDTVPAQSTWYNSAYFDEIYHARTALEHLEGVYPYEVSHPPLGKLIIGLGIRVFGMTPFGWRFMGTLFGVCMLPILYVCLLYTSSGGRRRQGKIGGNTLSKKDQKKDPIQESPAEHAQAQPSAEADCTPEAETAPDPLVEELEALKNELAEKESKYLRLAAEYDNFRKRSQKAVSYTHLKALPGEILLPQRGLRQIKVVGRLEEGLGLAVNLIVQQVPVQ